MKSFINMSPADRVEVIFGISLGSSRVGGSFHRGSTQASGARFVSHG
jgi:hypothetical protein